MKPSLAVGLFCLALSVPALATPVAAPAAPAEKYVSTVHFCVLSDAPPATAQYTVVKELKIGKGSYGSVDEAIDMLAAKAQKIGADAIINYSGSQRFGFWPWRFVHPVVRGTAIKWKADNAFDCAASGRSLR